MVETEVFTGTFVQSIVAIGGILLVLIAFAWVLARIPKWVNGRARQRQTTLECQCGYDLRGTIKAKADTCPECGRAIVE